MVEGECLIGREGSSATFGLLSHQELKAWEGSFCLSKTFSSKSYLTKSISKGAETCKCELMFGVLQHLFNLCCPGLEFRNFILVICILSGVYFKEENTEYIVFSS